MEEGSLAILAEIHQRLKELISEGEPVSPPKRLQPSHAGAVLLGKASDEQRAIATLYDRLCFEHWELHKVSGLPEKITPRVDVDHHFIHVAAPLLKELLIWSAHRDYPDVSETMSISAIEIDANWNLHAVPKETSQVPKQM